jgi:hypothetical protein
MVGDMMPPAPGRLGDGGIEEVGADRHLRGNAETRDEQGRHQRAAADAGQPDEQADGEASRHERQQQLRCPRDINHC